MVPPERDVIKMVVALALSMTLSSLCSAQATITVNATGGADFTDIQSAIDAAVDGDIVLVERGEYIIHQPISYRAKAITLRGESGSDETIIRLSAPLVERKLPIVVYFEKDYTATSVLDGFTLTGAWGGGLTFNTRSAATVMNCKIVGNSGGGVACYKSAPTLINCTISGNDSGTNGGGLLCERLSAPTLRGCVISGNLASVGGGVFCARDSSSTFIDCEVTGNTANSSVSLGFSEDGGGIYCAGTSSATLTNCIISRNSTDGDGGGLYCEDSSPILTNCTIIGNSADVGGGGIVCGPNASPILTGCTISGNFGGGVRCEAASSPQLVNCVITGNSAVQGGGLYGHSSASPSLVNCTVAGNWAEESGGGIYLGGRGTLINCIVWDNLGGSLWARTTSRVTVSHSTIERDEVWPGALNINDDPRFGLPGIFDFFSFVDQMPDFIIDLGDYRLLPDSPCINTGASEGAPDVDIEGIARPCATVVDMGAHEYCTAGTRFKRGALR